MHLVGVDVGGTFTDIALYEPASATLRLHKVPSTPSEPDRAIVAGVAEALARFGLSAAEVGRFAHGTTVGTNALIERRVGRIAFVTTAGFRDLVEIGRQTRPRVYDVHLDHPAPLVGRELRFEVRERIRADGSVHQVLDTGDVAQAVDAMRRAAVDCVVIGFLNAYRNPAHERQAAAIVRAAMPGVLVSYSAELFPEFREYERFSTALLNGALSTVVAGYLDRLEHALGAAGCARRPLISQSAGGLMSVAVARREPIKASLSGPAAGVIGAAARARAAGFDRIITIDVGGTSADVALIHRDRVPEVHSRTLAGFPLRLPALDVNAVGAGGGSIARIGTDGLLKVGPQSAGAEPGPACYGRGGAEPTVTDANLVLGRLGGDGLLGGALPLRRDLAAAAVGHIASVLGLPLEDTAIGIIRVACGTMVNAIRTISIERGHDPALFSLFAFGGAGPLHATEVARSLGMRTIIVPPHPGVLCAEGLLQSDLRADFVASLLLPLEAADPALVASTTTRLRLEAEAWLDSEAVPAVDRRLDWTADLRYVGQNFEIALPLDLSRWDAVAAAFHVAHEATYGFAAAAEPIELVTVRLRAWGLLAKPVLARRAAAVPGAPVGSRSVHFDETGARDTPILDRAALSPGQTLAGPAVIEQLDTTVLVHPGAVATVDAWGNLVISLPDS